MAKSLYEMCRGIFHGSCIHHPRLDICSDEYNYMYHESLQMHLIEGIILVYKVYQNIEQKLYKMSFKF